MPCSERQQHINKSSSLSFPAQLLGYFSEVITEDPHQLPPEFMIRKRHLVSLPLLNIFAGMIADFPDYFGIKSTIYLSSALLSKTSRYRFLQMYLLGSMTPQTTCPTDTENSLKVYVSTGSFSMQQTNMKAIRFKDIQGSWISPH